MQKKVCFKNLFFQIQKGVYRDEEATPVQFQK